VLAGVLTACTGSADDSSPSTSVSTTSATDQATFAATLTQSRTDVGTPMINAELTNIGTEPVTVTSVAVSSPDLASVAPTPKDTTYAPGQIIDLRTPYGRPLCESDSLSSASYDLALDDGSTLTLPIDNHGLRWLAEIYRGDCAVRALGEVARVQFAPDASRTSVGSDPYLLAGLIVRRPAGRPTSEPFEIRELSGSVLLQLLPRTSGELPFTLKPGQRSARVPVLIGTFRCDAHALAASQQTFLLSAYARTSTVPTQRLILEPPAPLRAKAQRLLVDVCVA
jgi:hypothetical protein